MGIKTNHLNVIGIMAKSFESMIEQFEKIEKDFTVLASYADQGRHYALISLHEGVKKKVVKSKTSVSGPKKEKVKL